MYININGGNPVIGIWLWPAPVQFVCSNKQLPCKRDSRTLFGKNKNMERECILYQHLCFSSETGRWTSWSLLTGVSKSSKQTLFIVNTIYCAYSLYRNTASFEFFMMTMFIWLPKSAEYCIILPRVSTLPWLPALCSIQRYKILKEPQIMTSDWEHESCKKL